MTRPYRPRRDLLGWLVGAIRSWRLPAPEETYVRLHGINGINDATRRAFDEPERDFIWPSESWSRRSWRKWRLRK